MKHHGLGVLSVLALGLAGCINISSWKSVGGSGQVISEPRSVSQFHEVTLGGSGELSLVQGAEESLTIEADDNLLPLIESEVSGGRLWIGWRNVNLRPSRTIHYTLHVKDLDTLNLSGSLTARTGSLRADHMSISISGSGNIQIAKLEARTVSAHISGSGDTRIAGEVEDQKISISGSGSHHAADLRCHQAEAHISGSGRATLWVKDSLTSAISGSGSINYFGHPSVSSHVSGSGRLHHLGDKQAPPGGAGNRAPWVAPLHRFSTFPVVLRQPVSNKLR